jgi:hypothetical protein
MRMIKEDTPNLPMLQYAAEVIVLSAPSAGSGVVQIDRLQPWQEMRHVYKNSGSMTALANSAPMGYLPS